MIVILAHPGHVHGLRAIVGVEENQGFLLDFQLGDQIDDAANQGVEFMDKVAPGAGLGGSGGFR